MKQKIKSLDEFVNETIDENLIKYKKGLYQARPDDYIEVGVEGTRHKESIKIDKIVSNDRLQDENGNIWNRDGTLYRLKDLRFLPGSRKNKHVNAQLKTQEKFDQEHKDIKVDFLRRFKWEDMDIEDLEKIIDQLPIKQANRLRHSRFKIK